MMRALDSITLFMRYGIHIIIFDSDLRGILFHRGHEVT